MNLPFTTEEFFQVFVRYNQDVWPAQIALYGLAVSAIFFALRGNPGCGKISNGILAAFWFWMGAVYHLAYFSAVNRAAFIFGAVFILQSFVFIEAGILRDALQFCFQTDVRGVAGAALIAYALILYPMIGWFAGHGYPAAPTFGLPCPTTIFTFGMLLWVKEGLPWRVIAIPFLWSVIGSFAAVSLTVIEDYGLLAAGLLSVTLIVVQGRRSRVTQSPE